MKIHSKRIEVFLCEMCGCDRNHVVTRYKDTDERTGMDVEKIVAKCCKCKAIFHDKRLPAVK